MCAHSLGTCSENALYVGILFSNMWSFLCRTRHASDTRALATWFTLVTLTTLKTLKHDVYHVMYIYIFDAYTVLEL